MSMLFQKTQILSAATLLLFFNFISSTEATGFDWVQQEFLKSHNNLRASVGVPPLQWDANLAAFSQSWANQRKQQCDYRQHSTSPYGENIFWELYRQNTASSIVQKWFAEKQFFNHATNQCNCQPGRAGCECGHYLNVIWKTTTKVGCSGFVYCDDQKGAIVVCSYDPIGNYKGVNPLNPVNNVGPTSPVLPPKPVNNGNVRRGRGRKRNVAVTSPVPVKPPTNPRKFRRGKGRRNKRA
ncbi:hypothetical protein RND71_035790 [Anisodus tanguticus]|uniref:SCP domain-containing protein n=1 Tax=Anisodus tanguticus TaxID=243964 RepID=A0AAE1R4X5_9SOLA|nr:hypothetical protein RND71_035790 [Anisodus tanguticus]